MNAKESAEISKQSLAERVYQHLMSILANGHLTIGARIKPGQFTEQLGVSRTTVNAAVTRLISEGWLKNGEKGRILVAACPPKGQVGNVVPFDFSSQADSAYEVLLDHILRGDHKPGEILKERPIAEELGVNPATVRRAAEWLRNDGLLERLPRRGWRVARLHLKDVQDIFLIRQLLEPLTFQGAVNRITDEALDELEAECDRLIKAGEKANASERRKADYHFHHTIAEASGSRTLADTLDPLVRRVLLITTVGFRYTRATRTFEEHREIIRALRRRDGDEASRLIKAHLKTALKHNLETWQEP